jgi:hypothetical protein
VVESILPLVFVIILALVLLGLVRAIDRDELSQKPEGLLSPSGFRLVVGGGFAFGFLWGFLTGWGSGPAVALLRGLTVGLLSACAGALYMGAQQRGARRRRGG